MVEDPDADRDTYTALPSGTYNDVIKHIIESYDVDPGRELLGSESVEATPPELSADEVLESDTTLNRREVWRAASAVTPGHLDGDLAIEQDGDAWLCPTCGDRVRDAVWVVGLTDGAIECCSDTLADPAVYDRCYTRLREEFDAPVPEFIPPGQIIEDRDRAMGATQALRGWDILDGLQSTVTDDNPSGRDAVATIDTGWEDSESGERIVLFDSGLFYCREHETVLWPLQVVGLEHGFLDDEDDWLRGDDWLQAYALARTEYGGPLPEIVWNDADNAPEPLYLPVLPDADELLGEGVTTDGSALDDARSETAELYRDIADSDRARNHLMTALPALGKSYNAVVQAADHPTLYAAKRLELREEAEARAGAHGVSNMHLPTLGEGRPPEIVLQAAVEHIQERGREALRDRHALLAVVEDVYHASGEHWSTYEDAWQVLTRNLDCLGTVVADKGFDWDELRHMLREEGVRPVIKHREFYSLDAAHNVRIDDETYHQRSIVESIFFALRKRFGSTIKARTWFGQFREIVLKAAVGNIEQSLTT